MNPHVLNIICLLILIGFAIWSLVLWFDGNRELAQYVLVWAIVLPAVLRGLTSA